MTWKKVVDGHPLEVSGKPAMHEADGAVSTRWELRRRIDRHLYVTYGTGDSVVFDGTLDDATVEEVET